MAFSSICWPSTNELMQPMAHHNIIQKFIFQKTAAFGPKSIDHFKKCWFKLAFKIKAEILLIFFCLHNVLVYIYHFSFFFKRECYFLSCEKTKYLLSTSFFKEYFFQFKMENMIKGFWQRFVFFLQVHSTQYT